MTKMLSVAGVTVRAPVSEEIRAEILTDGALRFLGDLHRGFDGIRRELLDRRRARRSQLARGKLPDFLPETRTIREKDWRVGPIPADLADRRVEITGPAEPKMMINALNSGARCFMADFEDSLSPTWDNVMAGQLSLKKAVRRTLTYDSPEGKSYRLGKKLAVLLVRPRGWHLPESHIEIDGQVASGSLVDFGLYFYHNAAEALFRGSGPYFYLPKLESHLEARLWNDVFRFAQQELGIPQGSTKATILIETILAAFEMDEILHELRDHSAGLNAGRWDYIFSIIKNFRDDPRRVLPDRSQVTMAAPFMRAYTDLLVKTCHRRGATAIGGMAAFVPNRRDPEITERAIAKVREDKEREARAGFDGTWVAHPDLVPVATAIFDQTLGPRPNQIDRRRDDVQVTAQELLDFEVEGGAVTMEGVRLNISVALQYLERWTAGVGAVALNNLMEDAATAEISRAQLWQWLAHESVVQGKGPMTQELYLEERRRITAELERELGRSLGPVAELLDHLVLDREFCEFLTLPAYELLNRA